MELDGNSKETYLTLLEASLIKKSNILNQIIQLSEEQGKLLEENEINESRFYQIVDEKEVLIQSLLQLDKGFEQIYQRVREELSLDRSSLKMQITRMQELIKEITDKGINIEALEKRNKVKIDTYLKIKRSKIRNFKISSKSVTSYYNNMANQNLHEAYFFDKKK